MIEKLKPIIRNLTSLKEDFNMAEPLLDSVPSLRKKISVMMEEMKSDENNETDEMFKNELRRLRCNIWAIDHLYMEKINGQPLAKTDDEIKKHITGWIDNLIFRLEKYGS